MSEQLNIIKVGSRQFLFTGNKLKVPKVRPSTPVCWILKNDLLVTDQPNVEYKILSEEKGPKIIVKKHRRRKDSEKKIGFRAVYNWIEVLNV